MTINLACPMVGRVRSTDDGFGRARRDAEPHASKWCLPRTTQGHCRCCWRCRSFRAWPPPGFVPALRAAGIVVNQVTAVDFVQEPNARIHDRGLFRDTPAINYGCQRCSKSLSSQACSITRTTGEAQALRCDIPHTDLAIVNVSNISYKRRIGSKTAPQLTAVNSQRSGHGGHVPRAAEDGKLAVRS